MATGSALDDETRDLFARTLRGTLTKPGIDISSELEQVGWRDFLAVDPVSVVPLLFGIVGELVLASRALDDVAFAAAGSTGAELRDAECAFVHPLRLGDTASCRDDEIVLDGLILGGCTDAPLAALSGDVMLQFGASAFERTPVDGIDPALALVRVRGAVSRSDEVRRSRVEGSAVREACRRALAHELIGATDAMLTMATEYAGLREQFGRPIGAFQAVKHRLADVYVARQAAASVVEESWVSDPPCTTLAAKALAAHAGAQGAEHCLQVFGAIGFTLEHDLHRYVRRVRVLDRLYGSESELRRALGTLLRERGRVSRPGEA